jgi:hypothetical protein
MQKRRGVEPWPVWRLCPLVSVQPVHDRQPRHTASSQAFEFVHGFGLANLVGPSFPELHTEVGRPTIIERGFARFFLL